MRMSKRINIVLSQKGISDLSKKLEEVANRLDKVGEKIIDEMAEVGLKTMQENYNNSPYQDSEGMGFSKTGTMNEKKISMIGTQAIYTEFGTGTEGQNSPHPQKKEFDLKPYNSGKTIRRNKKETSTASMNGIPIDGLYWTYKDSEGTKHYTQGIPAQKIVYNASKTIQDKHKSIIKKAIQEVLQ